MKNRAEFQTFSPWSYLIPGLTRPLHTVPYGCYHIFKMCVSYRVAAGMSSVAVGNNLPDVADYLREIPLDWLSDAANLLSQTLQFGPQSFVNGTTAGSHDDGSNLVRIPPGQCCTIHLNGPSSSLS